MGVFSGHDFIAQYVVKRHGKSQDVYYQFYNIHLFFVYFVIVALLLFQRIFLFHVQFVNGMNTSYLQIRSELASEQLIKVYSFK